MVKPLFCCPDYLVDDRGFVISKRGKPLKPSLNHHGYQIINVMINGKRKGLGVHTAVARTFCDGFSPELQVNHKDGNKTNNNASNLEWIAPMENVRHAIDKLGYNNKEGNNSNAKAVIGKDKKTLEIVYRFPALISAGRYFSNNDENRAKHIRNIIYKVIDGRYYGRRTYKNCVWEYADNTSMVETESTLNNIDQSTN